MSNTVADLREQLDLRAVIHLLTGMRVFSRKICCPFHSEREPSFSVYRVKGGGDRFKCWGGTCGKKGDALDFVRYHEGLGSTKEVVEWLQLHRNELGIGHLDLSSMLAELLVEEKLRKFWTTLEQDCKTALMEPVGRPVRDWLEGRGVDGKTHQYLPIGCFDWEYLTQTKGYALTDFKAHGISGKPGSYPSPIIAFFYYSTPVTLSRIKLRFLNPKESGDIRVLGSELGGPMGFFGLDLLSSGRLDELLWVEGEMDVLVPQSQFMLQKNDRLDIICCSGSGMGSYPAAKNLESLGTKALSLWPDNDPSGKGMVSKVLAAHQRPGLYISVMWPKDYLPQQGETKVDPADYCVRLQSIDTILRRLTESETYIADWLAINAGRDFLKLQDPTSEDFVRLQEKILAICQRCKLTGLNLGNFLHKICTTVPALNYQVLYTCALSGQATLDPQRGEIGGITYVSKDKGYFQEMLRKDEIYEKQISDFQINLHRWVKAYDPLQQKYRYFGEGEIVRAGGASRIVLRDSDFRTWQDFKAAVHAVDNKAVMDASTWSRHFDEIIRLLNRGVEDVTGSITVGQLPGQKYVTPKWYVHGGKVYENTDIPVVLKDYSPGMLIHRCDTPLIKDKSILDRGAKMIGEDIPASYADPFIPLTIMGHIAISPVVDILKVPKGILYVEGQTEAGKTVTAQLLMNMAWDYPLSASNVNVNWTVNSIEMALMFFSGLPVLIDDAKSEVLKQSKGQFLRMIQNYYDRQGRGRLDRNSQLRAAPCINGNLILTGESLPIDSQSGLNRMVTLTFPPKCINLKKVLKLKKDRHCITALWPYYIAWLQRRTDLEIKSFVKFGAGRLRRFIDYMGTGLDLYLQFLHEEFGLAGSMKNQHMTSFLRGIGKLISDNTEVQQQNSDAALYVETLAEIVSGNPALIDDVPGLNLQKLGFRKGNVVYVFPNLSISAVSRQLAGRPFSRSSLAQRLVEGGYLELPKNAKSDDGTVRPRVEGKRERMWPIKADRLYGTLPDPADDPNSQFL